MMLRRAWRTQAADIGLDEFHTRILMGHSLRDVSEGYVNKLALSSGSGLRKSQRRMSKRIEALLAGK